MQLTTLDQNLIEKKVYLLETKACGVSELAPPLSESLAKHKHIAIC